MTLTPQQVNFLNLAPLGVAALTNVPGLLSGDIQPQSLIKNMFIFVDLQANVVSAGLERHLVKHGVPGREGEVLQDMGGKSTKITIDGKWIYENTPDDGLSKLLAGFNWLFGSNAGWNWVRVEMMKTLARINLPLFLACDLFIGPVLIEKVNFKYLGGQPNVYDYSFNLVEWNPALSLIGTGIVGSFQTLTGRVGGGLSRGF